MFGTFMPLVQKLLLPLDKLGHLGEESTDEDGNV